MKLSFCLKTISALSLMIALSVVVRSNVQQPVRAQTQNEVEAEALSEAPSEVDCDAVLAAVEDEGFDIFQGIKLTSEQEAAYRRADAERSAESDATVETIPSEGGVMVIVKDGVTIPDDVLQEMEQATTAIGIDQVPNSEQLDELNARYGQYAEFTMPETVVLTPENIAKIEAIKQKFIKTMLSILTPEQQPIYLRNLETERVILDCI